MLDEHWLDAPGFRFEIEHRTGSACYVCKNQKRYWCNANRLYLVTAGQYTKIGISKQPCYRLTQIRSCVKNAELFAVLQVDNAEALEFRLHQRFNTVNLAPCDGAGIEWFRVDPFKVLAEC